MNEFESETWLSFTKIARNFDMLFDLIIKEEEITKNQALTMFLIASNENMRINDIKNQFACNQGNVSSLCKKLEQMELIQKVRNKTDERIVNLVLLPKGKLMMERIRERFKTIEKRLSSEVKEDLLLTLSNLNKLSIKLIDIMKGV